MKSFVSRRLRNTALTVATLGGFAAWTGWREAGLRSTSFDTGYALFAAILFLALYNLRKKLPVLPWTTSGGWLQTHLYVGLGTAILFGLHVGWRMPDGIFEMTLAGFYLATFASGLIGLYWTRTLPRKLARVSEEVIYERIPLLRSQLRDRAQQAVLETVGSAGATTLSEFYSERLHHFFEQSRGWRYMLRPNNRLRRQMLDELTEVNRYLSEPERKTCEQLFALIRRRDDLDYHAALQWRLKGWLFLHIGLTYPLVAIASVHGLLAHLFAGRAVRESLQEFKGDTYERPNQPWLCGLADEGASCPTGPGRRGRCPGASACHPLLEGDRWVCNRSPARGGPCENGPSPDGSCSKSINARRYDRCELAADALCLDVCWRPWAACVCY